MKFSKLKPEELAKRAAEVFILKDGDTVLDAFIDDSNKVTISIREFDDLTSSYIDTKFEPNMKERPEALAYIMGERTDFND